jgi:hypothetical protein
MYLDSSQDLTKPSASNNDNTVVTAVTGAGTGSGTFIFGSSGSTQQLNRFSFAEDTVLYFLDGCVLWMAEAVFSTVGIPVRQANDTAPTLSNRDNWSYFPIPEYLPDNVAITGSPLGYVKGPTASGTNFKATRFFDLNNLVVMRHDWSEEIVDDESGSGRFGGYNSTSDACLLHLGLRYKVEIETLDIDDPTDPVSGLPMTIGETLIRLRSGNSIKVGKDRESLSEYTDLTQQHDAWSKTYLWCEGVLSSILRPGWSRNGKMVIQNVDALPFYISGVYPQVTVGDIDG